MDQKIKLSALESVQIEDVGDQVKTTFWMGSIPAHTKMLDISKAYLLGSAYAAAAEAAERHQRLKQAGKA